jgi:hypothetical protein
MGLICTSETASKSGAKRAHSKTLARYRWMFENRQVLECVRFAPLSTGPDATRGCLHSRETSNYLK